MLSKKSKSRGRPRRKLSIRVPRATSSFLRILIPKQRVAELLCIGVRTVDHLIARGELSSVNIGDRRMVSLASLFAFAETDRCVQEGKS